MGSADGDLGGAVASERLSDAALDALFRFAPMGLALLDDAKRYVRVNGWLAMANGRSADEHIGRTPGEILGPAGQAVEAALDHVLETGLPLVGAAADPPITPGPGGEPISQVSMYPLFDGDRVIGVLGWVVSSALGAEQQTT